MAAPVGLNLGLPGVGPNYLFVVVPNDGYYSLDKTDGSQVGYMPLPPLTLLGAIIIDDIMAGGTVDSGNYNCRAYDHNFNPLWNQPDRILSNAINGELWLKDSSNSRYFYQVALGTGLPQATLVFPSGVQTVYGNSQYLLGNDNVSAYGCNRSDMTTFWAYTPGAAFGGVRAPLSVGTTSVFAPGGNNDHYLLKLSDGSELTKTHIQSMLNGDNPVSSGYVYVFGGTALYCVRIE